MWRGGWWPLAIGQRSPACPVSVPAWATAVCHGVSCSCQPFRHSLKGGYQRQLGYKVLVRFVALDFVTMSAKKLKVAQCEGRLIRPAGTHGSRQCGPTAAVFWGEVEVMTQDERLKVLFITGWYPKEQPTAHLFIREHAKAVSLYDDVVVLHCAEPDSNLNGLWRLEQETDESLTEGIPTYRVWYKRLPIPKVSYFIYVWCIFQAFRWAVAQGFRPDIIHAHVYGPGLVAVLIGKLYRGHDVDGYRPFPVPVVITWFGCLESRTLFRFPKEGAFPARSRDGLARLPAGEPGFACKFLTSKSN